MKNFMDKPKTKLMTQTPIDYLKLLFLIALCFLSLSVFPNDKNAINKILNMSEAPDGVVFELIGSENSKYLPNALSKVEAYKNQLKKKFPSIDIAVVSHGSEQFELTTDNAKKEKKSHNLVKRITSDDVPVHICATHASWRNIDEEDFPEYITISAQAPIQIKQYQELGYILVIVD